MKNSRPMPSSEERIIPVTLKVYHRQRRVDCEYRFDETDGKSTCSVLKQGTEI